MFGRSWLASALGSLSSLTEREKGVKLGMRISAIATGTANFWRPSRRSASSSTSEPPTMARLPVSDSAPNIGLFCRMRLCTQITAAMPATAVEASAATVSGRSLRITTLMPRAKTAASVP